MGDDLQLSINTAECLANLAEDGDGRSEIAKNNGITLLGQAILKSDVKLQSVAALALARCLNDGEKKKKRYKKRGAKPNFSIAECRIGFGSKPANVNALIELIKSKDVKVSRHAALALSNACELGK